MNAGFLSAANLTGQLGDIVLILPENKIAAHTANFILVGTFSLHEHDVYVCEHDVSMVIATFLTG